MITLSRRHTRQHSFWYALQTAGRNSLCATFSYVLHDIYVTNLSPLLCVSVAVGFMLPLPRMVQSLLRKRQRRLYLSIGSGSKPWVPMAKFEQPVASLTSPTPIDTRTSMCAASYLAGDVIYAVELLWTVAIDGVS
jgi:hypothetical protein